MNGGSGVEKERKFLVSNPSIIAGLPSARLVQGYPVLTEKVELRVRTGPSGQVLTIKGQVGGLERPEEELVIKNRLLALALMEACDGRILVKTRYMRHETGPDGNLYVWVIDEYDGDNRGLFVAEYEYPDEANSPDSPDPPIPSWVGREVTGVRRYYAQSLCSYPYRSWSDEDRGLSSA